MSQSITEECSELVSLWKQMKKSHCGLNESMNFNPVGRLAKHGVRNITFQSLQWITGCTSWKHWTNNRIQIWFLQKCQRKKKFQRMRLWTSARLQSTFLSQTLFGLKWCRNAHRNFFVFWSRDWKIMLDLAGGTTVYLACGATDLRKSYHGLAAIIKLKFKLDPYSRCMFAFCNRRRTSIKILQWDGFVNSQKHEILVDIDIYSYTVKRWFFSNNRLFYVILELSFKSLEIAGWIRFLQRNSWITWAVNRHWDQTLWNTNKMSKYVLKVF